jgi:hypothetical protein
MHYFVSLWNYLYYPDDKSLDEILREIDDHGFGVELWPAISTFDRPTPRLACAPPSPPHQRDETWLFTDEAPPGYS